VGVDGGAEVVVELDVVDEVELVVVAVVIVVVVALVDHVVGDTDAAL
jgi:hypothetical protein